MIKRIFKKIFFEFTRPQNYISQKFLHNFHQLINKKFFKNNQLFHHGVLIWDIRSQPITFDIVLLVYHAHIFFFRKKIYKFNVVLFIPKEYKFKPFDWEGYSNFINSNDLKKRIKNMIIPILSSYSCIDKVIILKRKNEIIKLCKKNVCYPEFYNPYYYLPIGFNYESFYRFLKKNITPIPYIIAEKNSTKVISYIRENIENKDYITFTLRDYGYSPNRNSSSIELELVNNFAKEINKKLILIPDKISELNHYEIPNEVIIDKQARKNIFKRIALYEKSRVNVFMLSGPAEMSHFIKSSKTIILNFGVPSFDGSIKFIEKEYGIKYNEQPYLRLKSFLIWYKNGGNISNEELMNAYLQVKD